jgi:hypothetical protein
VAKAPVPDICGGDGAGVEAAMDRGHADGVQVAGGITPEDHPLGSPVLDRKAKVVKLNVNRIIATQGFNRDEVLN